MRKGLVYFAGLTALYLGLHYATGAGQLISSGANGAVAFDHSLQGR